MSFRRMKIKLFMIMVVVIALLLSSWLGLKQRSNRFDQLHWKYSDDMWRYLPNSSQLQGEKKLKTLQKIEYYNKLKEKYRWASGHPWLPVAPDPPSPPEP